MKLVTAILLICGGVVLRANEQWFNGADTVGTVLLWTGIIGAAITLLFWIFAAWIIARS